MNTKSKAVVGALAAAAVGATVVGTGATSAYFFDAEQAEGHRLEAGSLDLEYTLSGSAVQGGKIRVDNVAPGDPAKTFTVKVTNTGSVDGKVSARITDVVNAENGRWEPETSSGDRSDNVGELGSYMRINAGSTPRYFGSVSLDSAHLIVNNFLDKVRLGSGDSTQATFTVWLPDSGRGDRGLIFRDNVVMSDRYEFDLDLSLSQK